MRKTAGVFLLLACIAPFIYGQKTRFGQEPPFAKPGVDYPDKIHVSAIRIRSYCDSGTCYDTLYADTTLNSSKIELMCGLLYESSRYQIQLALGDYPARLTKQTGKIPGTPLYDEYELVLHDRRVLSCTVSGISE